MTLEQILKALLPISPLLALTISGIALVFSIRGFYLSRKIQRETQADEVLIPGELHNPNLQHPDHENCVIQTIIFNKSKRKAYINHVQVFDRKNQEIDISWSNTIDHVGNPQDRSNLIGIIDSAYLCIRRNDGLAFNDVTVKIQHSFKDSPLILKFDPLSGWQEFFAKS